jgi:spermidine synthase
MKKVQKTTPGLDSISATSLVILGCFFLSGMAGLVYEVVWTRKLTLIFGTTLYSVSAVIAIFMGGLALGSLIFGRLADRMKRPLLLYAVLEVSIGVYAALTPVIIGLIEGLQIALWQRYPVGVLSLSWVNILLVTAALILPTTLMGGTLPVMTTYFVRHRETIGRHVARLYSLNTLGGAAGSLIAGYILIATFGMNGTIYGAALINLAVGVTAWRLQRSEADEDAVAETSARSKKRVHNEREQPEPAARHLRPILLGTMLLSGFAALSLEVSWSRVLTLVLGGSVYAFSTILAAFLLGIALGSLIVARFVDRMSNPWRQLAIVEFLIGVSAIGLNGALGLLPFWFLKIYELGAQRFWAMQWLELGLALAIMLVPTTLMGMTFPIAVRIFSRDIESLGESVGKIYFANTIGSVLGPLATGFLLIPMIGIQSSLLAAAVMYLILGAVLMAADPHTETRFKMAAGVVLAAGVLFVLQPPRWDSQVMNSGVYIYADRYIAHQKAEQGTVRESMLSDKQLYYREGLTATVTVSESANNSRALQINGKTDASTGSDADTELLLGHLPMLIHRDPKNVLLVGLGSGITLGAVEQYPIERVDAVEIEAAVVEAAEFFSEANNNALDDPRLNMVVDDARHFVRATHNTYDVITAEPSNPWISGVSNLFTIEQYQAYRKRLRPGGILFQWAHIYSMSPEDLRTVIATFQTVFPHTTVWQDTFGRDLFLLGSENPLNIDLGRLVRRAALPGVKKDLARIDGDEPLRLLNRFVMDEAAAARFARGAGLHTDDRPILEFSAPRNLYSLTLDQNLKRLAEFQSDVLPLLSETGSTEFERQSLRNMLADHVDSRFHLVRAEIHITANETELARSELESALRLDPGSGAARARLAGQLHKLATELSNAGNHDQALVWMLRRSELFPNRVQPHREIANTYMILGRQEEAIPHVKAWLERYPDDSDGRHSLGVAYAETERYDLAEAELKHVIELDQSHLFARNNLASVYVLTDRPTEAIEEFERSLAIEPDQPRVRERLRQLRSQQQ